MCTQSCLSFYKVIFVFLKKKNYSNTNIYWQNTCTWHIKLKAKNIIIKLILPRKRHNFNWDIHRNLVLILKRFMNLWMKHSGSTPRYLCTHWVQTLTGGGKGPPWGLILQLNLSVDASKFVPRERTQKIKHSPDLY